MQALEVMQESVTDARRALDEVLIPEDLQVGERDGASGGMTPESVDVAKALVAAGREGGENLLPDRRSSERKVSAGQSLGHRDDIRPNAGTLEAKPLAGAAEAADDLVDDEQHAVAAADVGDRGQVGVRRNQNASAGDDRLHDHRRDGFRQLEDNLVLQLAGAASPIGIE